MDPLLIKFKNRLFEYCKRMVLQNNDNLKRWVCINAAASFRLFYDAHFPKKKQPGEAYSDDLVFSICNYIYETENISLDSLNNHIEQFILKQMDYINENYTLDDSQQEADFIC